MSNYNRVILLGNLTRDPELRHTSGGTAMAKLGMAINRRYTANGEAKESVCFVDLVAWGKQAEVLHKYVHKGSQLMVEGRLEFSQWEDKSGGKRSKLEVAVENFQFVGGKKADGGGSSSGRSGERVEYADDPPPKTRKQAEHRDVGQEPDYGDIPF
jgi:single-strand DNA-binding protein